MTLLRVLYDFAARAAALLARALLLAVLTLALKIPLDLVGTVVADRQGYQEEAIKSVQTRGARRRPSSARASSCPTRKGL